MANSAKWTSRGRWLGPPHEHEASVKKLHGQGLSTGRTAGYCLVSSATILNWIKAGKLPAQRTAGGQYRIHRADLRSFMRGLGMKTEALDRDMRPACWEVVAGEANPPGEPCATCPIRLRSEVDCFTARADGESHARCIARCSDCPYYTAWSA